MRLLTRYLIKDVFYYFVVTIGVLTSLLLIYEVFDTRSELFSGDVNMADVVLFLIYSIPAKLALTLPLVGWIATNFAYGVLAKNREILAMVAAGVSYRRLAFPALLFGLGTTIFAFWFSETVAPQCETRARYLEKIRIAGKRESLFTLRKNVFVKGEGNRFYFMEEYQADTQTMDFPTIIQLDLEGGHMTQRLEATQGVLVDSQDPADPAGTKYWEFAGAKKWVFNAVGDVESYEEFQGPMLLKNQENLDKFLSVTKQPEEMGYSDLREHVALLAEKGDQNVRKYSTSLQQKLAFPVACVLMALLGFAAAVDILARHFARGFVIGLLVSVGYYVLNGFLLDLGEKSIVHPIVAGWAPLVAFALVVAALFQQLEKVR